MYAVRITQDGANDVAKVLAIDFASGDSGSWPASATRGRIRGETRCRRHSSSTTGGRCGFLDGRRNLRSGCWAAELWEIDPANGDVTELGTRGAHPVVAGRRASAIAVERPAAPRPYARRQDGDVSGTTTGVDGLVSHIRWAPSGNEIAFTIGATGANGGVRQDLYVWDLEDARTRCQLTSSGAAFGAEWRGVMANWGP